MQIRCGSLEDTQRVAAALGQIAEEGLVIALSGDLGAGKTTFVQGLARGLGVPPGARVRSPTFTIANQHRGRLLLHHVDLYRVDDLDELYELGIADAIGAEGVSAVEWPERCPALLPEDRLELRLDFEGEGRVLSARATGEQARRTLARWEDLLPR